MIKATLSDGRVIYLPDGSTMEDIAAAVEALPDIAPNACHGWSRATHVERYRPDNVEHLITEYYEVTLTAPERRPAFGIIYGTADTLAETLANNKDDDPLLSAIPSKPGVIHPSVLARSSIEPPDPTFAEFKDRRK
jgi:hypothetical protein